MKRRSLYGFAVRFLAFALMPVFLTAQGTLADYERANGLRAKFQGLALNIPDRSNWIEKTGRFWYRKTVKGGNEFVIVDAAKASKKPAFDQAKLAAALSTATGEKYTAVGWPLGPEYAASSNVDNAYRLQGKLLLVVGEMDQNVDPASTLQVVNALIKANKTFDLLVIPGGGHGPGGAYGERKRNDFFVHNLLGVEPPDWNKIKAKK